MTATNSSNWISPSLFSSISLIIMSSSSCVHSTKVFHNGAQSAISYAGDTHAQSRKQLLEFALRYAAPVVDIDQLTTLISLRMGSRNARSH